MQLTLVMFNLLLISPMNPEAVGKINLGTQLVALKCRCGSACLHCLLTLLATVSSALDHPIPWSHGIHSSLPQCFIQGTKDAPSEQREMTQLSHSLLYTQRT